MSRADEFNKSYEKPAARYVEWSSDEKQFRYWDAEKESEILIPLPFKFIVLMERHTIRGFNEKSNSRIFSNEVEELKSEELTVKSFEGGLIAKGAYSTIKDLIVNAGGHYAKSIYILTDEGEVWNMNLKGSAVFAWGEFLKKDRKKLISHAVEVADAEQLKKGKIDYSVPVMSWGKAIPAKAAKVADDSYDSLLEKLSARAQSLSLQAETDGEAAGEKSKSATAEKLQAAKDGKKGKKKKKKKEKSSGKDDSDFPSPDDMPNEVDVDF